MFGLTQVALGEVGDTGHKNCFQKHPKMVHLLDYIVDIENKKERDREATMSH